MRRKASGVSLALLAAVALAARGRAASVQLDAGGSHEDYGFAAPGGTQWSQLLVRPSDRWAVLGAQTFVKRFGMSQGQGGAGVVWNVSKRSALEGRLLFSPEAVLLPAFAARALWYQGLPGGFTLYPGWSYSRYQLAHVHSLSAGLDWERSRLVATGRVYGTLTDFRSGAPSRLTPAALAQLKLLALPRLWLVPSWGYREESFESGSPGAFGSALFQAYTLGFGAQLDLPYGLTARAAHSQERRVPRAFVRQWDFSLSWKPGS